MFHGNLFLSWNSMIYFSLPRSSPWKSVPLPWKTDISLTDEFAVSMAYLVLVESKSSTSVEVGITSMKDYFSSISNSIPCGRRSLSHRNMVEIIQKIGHTKFHMEDGKRFIQSLATWWHAVPCGRQAYGRYLATWWHAVPYGRQVYKHFTFIVVFVEVRHEK